MYYQFFLLVLCVRLLGVDTSDITYVPIVHINTNNYCFVCMFILTRAQDGPTV